jgi:hypothetical protein
MTSQKKYWVSGFGLLVAWLVISKMRSIHLHKKHQAAFEDSFGHLGAHEPILKESSSYSLPTFTLIFPSESALAKAEAAGSVTHFKRAIQALYGHVGGKSNPFDADKAVWATHVGWSPGRIE